MRGRRVRRSHGDVYIVNVGKAAAKTQALGCTLMQSLRRRAAGLTG